MWHCKATNPRLFLRRLSYAMVQIKTLAPNTQGPSLSQIHPRGEFSTFAFSCREAQAWEGQVLLLVARLNTLKKVKAQPLGFKKGHSSGQTCNGAPKPGQNLVKIDYYTENSICCLSNKLLKQMHWLCNYTCRNFKHQKNTKTLSVFQVFKFPGIFHAMNSQELSDVYTHIKS